LNVVKLDIDFLSDGIAHLRGCMILQGWNAAEVEKFGDGDVPDYYFESKRRRVAPVPRVVKIADDFHCPSAHQVGWEALQNKVRRGEDLNPHLSKRHASLFMKDGLLAEWGVHHFHLGTEPSPRNPAYVTRTSRSARWSMTRVFARSTFIRTTVSNRSASLRAFIETGLI
jgi:hypothetical protein